MLAKSQRLDCTMTDSETTYSMLTASQQHDLGNHYISAILAFIERMAGMEDYPWPVPSGESKGKAE